VASVRRASIGNEWMGGSFCVWLGEELKIGEYNLSYGPNRAVRDFGVVEGGNILDGRVVTGGKQAVEIRGGNSSETRTRGL